MNPRYAAVAALALLAGCATPPARPRVLPTYPSAAEPFVYDVKLPGYLICGGRDGTKRVRLKLPTAYSAVEFNHLAGLALVLGAPDDSLARPFVHFYDADGNGLGWLELPRQMQPGANFTQVWLGDRPEALVFIAGGFRPAEQPGPAGRHPETYYAAAPGTAVALGLTRTLAVRFLPAGGYVVVGRDARDHWVVRRYAGSTRRWEQPCPAPASGQPVRLTGPGSESRAEFLLEWGGRRYAGTSDGDLYPLDPPVPAARP